MIVRIKTFTMPDLTSHFADLNFFLFFQKLFGLHIFENRLHKGRKIFSLFWRYFIAVVFLLLAKFNLGVVLKISESQKRGTSESKTAFFMDVVIYDITMLSFFCYQSRKASYLLKIFDGFRSFDKLSSKVYRFPIDLKKSQNWSYILLFITFIVTLISMTNSFIFYPLKNIFDVSICIITHIYYFYFLYQLCFYLFLSFCTYYRLKFIYSQINKHSLSNIILIRRENETLILLFHIIYVVIRDINDAYWINILLVFGKIKKTMM